MASKVKFTATLKNKWIKALRSGKFKQTTGTLSRGRGPSTSYCCLGVLCKVAGHRIDNNYGILYNSSDKSPKLLSQNIQNTLSDLNDHNRLDFNEIAGWIKKNVSPKRDAV